MNRFGTILILITAFALEGLVASTLLGDELVVTRDNVTLTYISRNTSGTNLTSDNINIVDVNLKTYIFLHGYMRGENDTIYDEAPPILLENEDCGIILVYWDDISDLFYTTAISLLNETAYVIADIIIEAQIELNRTEIVGFSLGAQLAGYLGRSLKDLTGFQVNKILNADPAGPLFNSLPIGTITAGKGDALLVIALHTSITLGSFIPSSNYEFYANGGSLQPGCSISDLAGCSHVRAQEYYIEALQNKNAFVAVKCTDNVSFQLKLCDNNQRFPLLGNYTIEDSGAYYFDTNSESPYSLES